MSSLKSYRAITVADLGVRPDQNEHAESAFAPLPVKRLIYLWQVAQHWWNREKNLFS